MSTVARLIKLLDEIMFDAAALVRDLKVNYVNRRDSYFVIVAPDYYWAERTPSQDAKHLELMRKYRQCAELLDTMMRSAPESLVRDYNSAKKELEKWLELGSNWSITENKKKNVESLEGSADGLRRVLSTLAAVSGGKLLLVPDTNALLYHADPVSYRQSVGSDEFVFVLLPTVLQELDSLKMLHRVPEVREKAQKVIARIKGWRTQGSLSAGVTVDGTILVRAMHKEPDLSLGPSWLSESSADDRIISSVLALQSDSPSSRVVLATADINLLNKADAVLIETLDSDLVPST